MVSVCIATYNGGEMLRTQLASILPQLSPTDEIVISEDGDLEETRKLVADITTVRCVVVEGPRVHSPIYNFENALRRAKGDIIFLSDQDDKWCEGKVATMCAALKDCECVCSDCYVTDKAFNITAPSFYGVVGKREGKFFNLLRHNCYLGCCMAFRRTVLEKALPFPKKLPMHDIWIGNVSAFFYRLRFIDDKLILFRRHGENASSTAGKSDSSFLQKIQYRYQVIKGLCMICFRNKRKH